MWATSLDLIRASIFVSKEIYGDVASVNNNVKKQPLSLLLNYKANPLLELLWMHWVLFTHNISCN